MAFDSSRIQCARAVLLGEIVAETLGQPTSQNRKPSGEQTS